MVKKLLGMPAVLATLGLALGFGSIAHAQSTAEQMKALIGSGDDGAAYALGRAASAELGDPSFDFYFGIAAVSAGAPGEGTLALERYVMHYPHNRSARFHLARGYFVMGEDLRAQDEFLSLLDKAEPQERKLLQSYLDAIRMRSGRYAPLAGFFVEGSLGHDNNINGGLAPGPVGTGPTWVIPAGSIHERVAGRFSSWAAGMHGSLAVGPRSLVYGALSARGRAYPNALYDPFDQQQLALQAGGQFSYGRQMYRLGFEQSQLRLYDQSYLSSKHLVAEWGVQADQFNHWGVGAHWGNVEYRDVLIPPFLDGSRPAERSDSAMRSHRAAGINARWRRSFENQWVPVWTNQIVFQDESNRRGRGDLSNHAIGLRSDITARPHVDWVVSAHVRYMHHRYGDRYAAGLPSRRDNQWSMELSARYLLTPEWSLSGHVYRWRQSSNIAVHSVSQTAYWIKLRYEYN